MKKGLLFLMVCFGFAMSPFNAEAEEKIVACRYTQLGDFSTSVSKSYNPNETHKRDINKFHDQESCNKAIEAVNPVTGKDQVQGFVPVQVCSGMVECEVAPDASDESFTNLQYEMVACPANKDGSCPGALACKWKQVSKGYEVKSLEVEMKTKTTPELDAEEVGQRCVTYNRDLGPVDCKKFCTSRCRKVFFENKEGEIDTCIFAIKSCR